MVGQWYADPTQYIIRLEVYRGALRANKTLCCCFDSNFRCSTSGQVFLCPKTEFSKLLSQNIDVSVKIKSKNDAVLPVIPHPSSRMRIFYK